MAEENNNVEVIVIDGDLVPNAEVEEVEIIVIDDSSDDDDDEIEALVAEVYPVRIFTVGELEWLRVSFPTIGELYWLRTTFLIPTGGELAFNREMYGINAEEQTVVGAHIFLGDQLDLHNDSLYVNY